MKQWFFFKIASQNIRNNTRLYLPRIMAEAGLLGCFYIMITLSMDRRLSNALGGAYLSAFMGFGAVVIGLLSLILILYVNSFLMKRRKSEYGLYNVLGLEKRHIVRVMFSESLITSLISIISGLLLGILFYKASSLLICRLFHSDVVAGFYYLSTPTIVIAAVIFLGMDLFAFSVNSVSIFRMKPAELLSEQHAGEREPRIKWFFLMTGILSLDGFRKRAEELLRTHPDTPYLLCYFNIKNFKFINESLGMAAGDDLLRFFAKRVGDSLTDEEALGRVTADRFVMLARNGGEDILRQDDQKVLGPVRSFFIDRGKETRVLISYGIYALTAADHQSINVDRMVDYAHVAEKKVRDTRNEGHDFYNPEQWEKGKQIAEVINHLPSAIKSGSLHVWYQPQVNYETGKITGAEALCRWDHYKLGFLYPVDFITVLEESGLIYDLDCFVWEKVCQDLRRWYEQGIRRFVSVNVSRCDIREDRDIPGQFSSLIQKYNISPDQLRIEITETAFAENPDFLISNTIKLRELGFQVEMDDFGSGYSSLHMLKEVPVDRIKLDLHFLTSSGDQKKSRTIVGCMIQMVELLEMKMIAEGVETVEQAEFLHDRGCSEMQGYYFYKPMPVEEFEKLNEVI